MQIKSESKFFVVISYLYLVLPFFIFSIGWLRIWVATPVVLVLVISFYFMLKYAPKLWVPQVTRENIEKIFLIMVIIGIWVYLSGIGRLVFQNGDHAWRDTIFEILMTQEWPVMGYGVDGSQTSLIYYIGFWLPAAVVGQLFGLRAGYLALFIWSLLGIALVYYLICARTKRLELWPLAILVLFSGLDYIGWYLLGTDMSNMSSTLHLEHWNLPYQLSSNTTQLFWVYNQSIPAWLATILLLTLKDSRSVVLVWASTMLASTFAFVGLLPVVIWKVVSPIVKTKGQGLKTELKELFTFENVFGGGLIGCITFLYLINNHASAMVSGVGQSSPYNRLADDTLLLWLLTILLEFGIFALLIYDRERKNPLFYIVALSLGLFPLLRVGLTNDFGMRAVIPAQFLLMLFVMDRLRETHREKKRAILIGLVVLLCIAAITPIHEITRTTSETIRLQREEMPVARERAPHEEVFRSRNFSGYVEESFFYRHLAR